MGGSWSDSRRAAAMNTSSPVGIFGGLPKGLDSRLDEVSEIQRQRALLRINKVADSCFRECCTDFGMTKYLKSGEQECISQCVEKYLMLSTAVGGSFADVLSSDPNAGRPRGG